MIIRSLPLALIVMLTLMTGVSSAADPPEHEHRFTPPPSSPFTDLHIDYTCPSVEEIDGKPRLLQLTCPALPDIPQPRIDKAGHIIMAPQPDWDYFSWNSFIALNWPARPVNKESGYQRGFPLVEDSRYYNFATFIDKKANATLNDPPLTVWETFKEKREIFENCEAAGNPKGCPHDPGPWNSPIRYLGQHEEVKGCNGKEIPAGIPHLSQGTKVHFDSLDETAEVLSEALESKDELCEGRDKESKCAEVYGKGVAPRVWRGKPSEGGKPVRYEVKVNYDYYRYVRQKRYYDDKIKNADAKAHHGPYIKLPYRSNDTRPPKGTLAVQPKSRKSPPSADPYYEVNNIGRVLGYSSAACLAMAEEVDRLKRNTGKEGDFDPCPVGAVQIKAAWVPITEEEKSRYHSKTAAYFTTEGKNKKSHLCRETGLFGLVGLHIIQRVHQKVPDDYGDPTAKNALPIPTNVELTNSRAIGGSFVFSTWEHVDVEKGGYYYSNYYPGKKGELPEAGFYPIPAHALEVKRNHIKHGDKKYPVILENTQKVNSHVHNVISKANKHSVWQYYKLIGTQTTPINVPSKSEMAKLKDVNPNDPTGIGQPLYLANLVIETNLGLQHFRGLPPNTDVISYQNNCQTNGSRTLQSDGMTHLSYVLDNPLDRYWHGEPLLKRPCDCLGPPRCSEDVTTKCCPKGESYETCCENQPDLNTCKYQKNCRILDAYNTVFGKYAVYESGSTGWSPVGYNMGGCMGCHGVSQLEGYSFSFVLQNGQAGAKPDSEIDFTLLPVPQPSKKKP